MKLYFFLGYWTLFIIGTLMVRSYMNYYRHHIQRHKYAERHRQRLKQLGRQLTLFS